MSEIGRRPENSSEEQGGTRRSKGWFHEWKSLWPTLVVMVVTGGLATAGISLPPIPLFMLAVVYTAYVGGVKVGIASAVITVGYLAWFLAPDGRVAGGDTVLDMKRIVMFSICTPLMAWMTGMLRRRADLHADSARREGELAAILAGREAAERLLAQNEVTYRAVFEANPLAMWICDSDTAAILAVNDAAVRQYGHSRAEFLRQTAEDLLAVGSSPRPVGASSDVAALLGEAGPARHRRKDGTVIEVESASHQITFTGRSALLVVARDVTEHRRAAEALRVSEEKFAKAFRASPDCLMLTSVADEKILEVNEGFVQLLGHSPKEAIGRTSRDLGIWVHREQRASVFRQILGAGAVSNLEVQLRHKDGTERTGLLSADVIEIDGRSCVLGVTRDVTERNKSEVATRNALLMLQGFIDSVPAFISFVDTNQRYQLVNRRYEEWFRRPRQEIVGLGVRELMGAASFAEARPHIEAALSGREVHYVRGMQDPDGAEHWLDVRYIPRFAEAGESAGFFTMVFDITAEKQAHEALRESQQRLDSILASLDDVVSSFSADGSQILFMNAAGGRVFGRAPAEFYDDVQVWSNAIVQEDRGSFTDWIGECRRGNPVNLEYRIARPDGTVRWLHDRRHPVRDASGKILRLDGIASDITERKQAEEVIRSINTELERRVRERTSALEAANKELESFSYSVSHDLRAPLRHISGFSQMLLENPALPDDGRLRHQLDVISSSAIRMGGLIEDLLAFSRTGRAEIRKVRLPLQRLVAIIIEELEPETADRSVEWRVDQLPEVEADPTLLRIVLQNLIGNAVKYTRKRERAVIEIGSTRSDTEVTIFVRDNGAGFDMQHAERLFGIFQRLHHERDFEGNGIGLANVQRVIHRHNGRVWAHGKAGEGATFYFSLPVIPVRQP